MWRPNPGSEASSLSWGARSTLVVRFDHRPSHIVCGDRWQCNAQLVYLVKCTLCGTLLFMGTNQVLFVVFFLATSGHEPVREWLKFLDKKDRKAIGEDIKLVQFRWPLGMPLVRKLEPDLWEVRSHLSGRRIARIMFTVESGEMALLHGFIKQSRKTPAKDLQLGRKRKNLWLSGRG